MGFFDKFRKPQPTTEQRALLSLITNPQQRAALLGAIARGEDIPDFAWEPLPEHLDTVALARRFHQVVQEATDVGPVLIDHVFSSMRIDPEWSVREPRGFTWWGHRLAQRVWAEPVKASDGYHVVRLSARTDFLRNVPSSPRTAEYLAFMNHHASMSALVWAPEEHKIRLHCTAYAHEETRDTVRGLLDRPLPSRQPTRTSRLIKPRSSSTESRMCLTTRAPGLGLTWTTC